MCIVCRVAASDGEGASYDEYEWWGAQSERATGEFQRYFIQPAFGLNKKIMHVSFIPRISVVDFDTFSNDVINYTIDENPIVFIEPAVAGKVNLMDNHFFFTFQAGFPFPQPRHILNIAHSNFQRVWDSVLVE